MTISLDSTHQIPKEARNWAMACHFMTFTGYLTGIGMFLGPLITWLVKKEDHPFIDRQGKEAVNFQITWIILILCCIPLVFVFIGILLLPILGIMHLVFTLIAGINAANGEDYRYPICFRFIE